MKNKLIDLNDHLFEQLERLNDEDLSDEQLEKEISRSKAITDIAENIINNGELMFKAQKHYDEYGIKYNQKNTVLLLGADTDGKSNS